MYGLDGHEDNRVLVEIGEVRRAVVVQNGGRVPAVEKIVPDPIGADHALQLKGSPRTPFQYRRTVYVDGSRYMANVESDERPAVDDDTTAVKAGSRRGRLLSVEITKRSHGVGTDASRNFCHCQAQGEVQYRWMVFVRTRSEQK